MDHQLEAAPGGGPHASRLTAPQQPPPGQLVCPRCNSDDTKFCYYNNYSISQPRYFCKTCRRYWTHGGALRNIPVGGGCRKSKRPRLAEAGQFQLQQQYYQDQLEIVDVKPRVNAAAQLQYNSTVMMGANLSFLSSNMGSSSITTIATTLTPSMFRPMNRGHGGGSMSSMTTIQAMNQTKPSSSGGGHSGFALPFFRMQATPRLPSGSTAGNIVLNSGARFLAITSSSYDGGAGGSHDVNTRNNNGSHEGLAASNNHPNQCPKFPGFDVEE